MRTLCIIPFYLPRPPDLVEWLTPKLDRAFGARTCVQSPQFDPERAFDPGRGQYNSRLLLARLLEETVPPGARILGLTAVDLFIPVLTFVFGEAQLGGQGAIVSVHRLRSELYGLPENAERLRERALKEAVHEIGHTYGLVHCESDDCVMRGSTYVEHIDLKPAHFCEDCLQDMRGSAAYAGG